MIKNHDRSKWFGASDTHYIMGNWNTKTFAKWWCVKLGLIKNDFQTIYTKAGTFYEHKIAKAIEEKYNTKLILDRQLKNKKLRLRVNLDSEDKETIYEIKTFKEKENWICPENYKMQVMVQMWATNKKGCIVAYPMNEENYFNYFLDIDKDKLIKIDIELDDEFIQEYQKRLKFLTKCLKKGELPNMRRYKNE